MTHIFLSTPSTCFSSNFLERNILMMVICNFLANNPTDLSRLFLLIQRIFKIKIEFLFLLAIKIWDIIDL